MCPTPGRGDCGHVSLRARAAWFRASRHRDGARRHTSVTVSDTRPWRNETWAFRQPRLERQVVVARPLVPRACVVARAVSRQARNASVASASGARMAVRNDLVRIAESSSDLIRCKRLAGTGEELLHRQVARARNAALARVARIAVLASELLFRTNVEDHQRRILEPARKLVARRNGVEARFEAGLHRMQLDLPDLQLARPRSNAAEENGDARMSRELRHLRRGHRAHAVAAVVEDEPLVAGHAVTPQAQADLRRERLQHLAIAHRRRRAQNERPRTGNVSARVRVRPAHVAEEQVVCPELAFEPCDVDDGRKLRHCRRTRAGSR